MMLALVCAWLVAIVVRATSPLEPLADLVMDRTPVPIAIPLLLRLGPIARPLALCGAIAIALPLGGLLARIYPYADVPPGQVRPTIGTLLRAVVVIGALAALVGAVLPDGNPLVGAVLIVAYLATLHTMSRRVAYTPGRRAFLSHNARILAGWAALMALLYVRPLVHAWRVRAAGRTLFAWSPPRARKPGFALPGLTPEITAPDAFYQMDEDLQQPDLDADTWSLAVDGLVGRPLRLSFADLLTMPRHDELVTQECISNPVGGFLMSSALFSGVPVRALLTQAGVRRGARAVLFGAPDGHEEAIPLDLALDGRVMLAYAKDGRLLEQAHGFPARALVPGLYGFKSIKWVETVRVTADLTAGHWERNGWNPLPVVQTTARIDVARRAPGGVLVAGVAFAGRRGIRGVQVRVNGGPWHGAILHTPPLSPATWVQWRVTVPARGRLAVQARAIDGTGRVQTGRVHDQQPSGATGYHTVEVTV